MSYIYRVFANPRSNNNDVMLIIDELDAFMHPRWQQEILDRLFNWWNTDELFARSKLQLFLRPIRPFCFLTFFVIR